MGRIRILSLKMAQRDKGIEIRPVATKAQEWGKGKYKEADQEIWADEGTLLYLDCGDGSIALCFSPNS